MLTSVQAAAPCSSPRPEVRRPLLCRCVSSSSSIAVFERLRGDGVTAHVAWRVCFVILPVPLLLAMIILNLTVGTDHPAGKWSQRHTLPATAIAVMHGEHPHLDHAEELAQQRKANEKEGGTATVAPAPDKEELEKLESGACPVEAARESVADLRFRRVQESSRHGGQ